MNGEVKIYIMSLEGSLCAKEEGPALIHSFIHSASNYFASIMCRTVTADACRQERMFGGGGGAEFKQINELMNEVVSVCAAYMPGRAGAGEAGAPCFSAGGQRRL